MFRSYGNDVNFVYLKSFGRVSVTYPTLEQARLAQSNLHNHEFQGTSLKLQQQKVRGRATYVRMYCTYTCRACRANYVYVCCWTDISNLQGRTQYKSDQASAELDLTFTNIRCQTNKTLAYLFVHNNYVNCISTLLLLNFLQ